MLFVFGCLVLRLLTPKVERERAFALVLAEIDRQGNLYNSYPGRVAA